MPTRTIIAGENFRLERTFFKKKVNHHGQTKRIYANRIIGGNCYYCAVNGDTNACTAASQGAGKGNDLQG